MMKKIFNCSKPMLYVILKIKTISFAAAFVSFQFFCHSFLPSPCKNATPESLKNRTQEESL